MGCSMEPYRSGICFDGYYAGWRSEDATQEICLDLCLKDSRCFFASLKPNVTCSRYDAKAGNCSGDGPAGDGPGDRFIYRKQQTTRFNANVNKATNYDVFKSTPTKPNVLLFLADDLGIGDLLAYSSSADIPTPAISALAEAGVKFTDAHAHPLCSPSRYSLLSGNYVFRGRGSGSTWGLYQHQSQFVTGQKSIAAEFRSFGYETVMLGKVGIGGRIEGLTKKNNKKMTDRERIHWLLTRSLSKKLGDGPADWGFDHSLTLEAGFQGPPYAWFHNGYLQANRTRCWGTTSVQNPGGVSVVGQFQGNEKANLRYSPCADSDTDLHDGDSNWLSFAHDVDIVNWLRRFFQNRHFHAADGGGDAHDSSVRPFFALVSTAAVHIPHTPPNDFFGQKIAQNWVGRPHAAMVAELDAVVRILLATLQKQAELDNTIVVFTSDNGGLNAKAKQIGAFTPSQSSMRPDFSNFALVGPDSSDGLRGHKGSLHEGGHRVPLIIAWADGGVPAGATCSDLVGLHDLYATLLDLVGAPQPQHGQAVDSLSFKQRLISPESGRPARNELLVPGSNLKWALREKGLKLIGRVANNVHIATQLFDLNVDRNETHNLLNRNVQSGMLQQYVQNVHEKNTVRLLGRVKDIGTPVAQKG